ncbi:DUF2283 domain-containing protein [Nonomuraea lactucae]|uniref:DUF2283 domain-containing protein n=1 Tax=Nonomuraea lactucae TaxID=2249762 RepID=UPI000DE543F8|nr:DUF2283 domain-containing protein [Nonomuraea lactucae]
MYEIAHRTLTLRGEPPGEVTVTIGLPTEEPTGEWSCPYRIDGLAGWEHERKVTGVDPLEALELVLAVVRAALARSHEAREGLLSWEDEPGGRRPRTVYLTRDIDHDVAYLAMKHEIAPGEAVRQAVVDGVVLDFGESGELLGVELEDAARLLPSEMRL